MMNRFETNHTVIAPLCRSTQEQLSDYIDNTLSARQVWDVEKHLAGCKECAEVSRQMQATVHLMRETVRLDTGDDFMAKLHARLDTLEPEPARRAGAMDWLRDVTARMQAGLSVRRHAPMLSLGMAAAGVVALVVMTHLPTPTPSNLANTPVNAVGSHAVAAVHENLQRNVAFTANDPLGDVAAENLENVDATAGANGG